MEKDLNEGLHRGRPLIKKMNRDSSDTASSKDFQNLEYEEMMTDSEMEQMDEQETENELDAYLSDFDTGEDYYVPEKKIDTNLSSTIKRVVSVAIDKGLLPSNWFTDQDYVDAITDKVKEITKTSSIKIKQEIGKIWR